MKFLLIAILAVSVFTIAQESAKFDKEYADDPVVLLKTSKGDIYIELFAKEAPKTVANFLELAEGKKEFTDIKTGKKVTKNYYDGLVFHRVIDQFMIQGGCPLGTGTGGPGYSFEDEISAKSLGLDKEIAFPNGQPHQFLGIRSRQQFQMSIIMPLLKQMNITTQEDLNAKAKEVTEKVSSLTLKDCFELMGYKYDDALKSHQPKRGVLAMANSGPNTNGSQFFINVVDTPWLAGKHTVFGKVLKGMDIVDAISKAKAGPAGKPESEIKIISVRKVK